MRTLWSVSDGEYSDYSVCALFEERADAEAAAAAWKDADVEEFICYSRGEAYRNPTWKVRARFSPNAVKIDDLSCPGAWWGRLTGRPEVDDWQARDGWRHLDIEADNPQAVRQSFSDRCAQYKAESGATWPTPDLQWD